jgi:hypothetical protein
MIDCRYGRKQMMCSYCMSIFCEWNVLTLLILSLALSIEFALAHASAGKRVGWKPLLCSHVSCGAKQRCRDPHSFHPAANITSREWLKVLASYLLLRFSVCAYEQFGRNKYVVRSSQDVATHTQQPPNNSARRNQGCHQIRWADWFMEYACDSSESSVIFVGFRPPPPQQWSNKAKLSYN